MAEGAVERFNAPKGAEFSVHTNGQSSAKTILTA